MDRLWKYLMQMDAKALFFGSVALFFAVLILVSWFYLNRSSDTAQPQKKGHVAVSADCLPIGVLEIISNQMTAATLVVPVNPFRSGIENMSFLPNPRTETNSPDRDPVSRTNRPGKVRPPGEVGTSSRPADPVIQTLTFRGFFSRPDGTPAALFNDSASKSNIFFTPGSLIRDASLITANIHTARVQKADGQTIDLAIGESFTLPAVKP
ncbi:MAG: hypothetical protein ACOYOU_14295 [Kiritimatiellia bacterium]